MAVENGYTYTLSGSDATITDFDPTTSSHGYDPVIPTSFSGGSYPVVAVADNAFKNKSLTSVQIDHTIDLGDNSFSDNGTLTVTINANVTTNAVGSSLSPPFENCSIGSNLTIGGSVTTIPKYLFNSSGITSVTISSNITVIDDYAFNNNSISTLSLGHVVDLGDRCFAYNSGLTLSITANVTTTRVANITTPPFLNCAIAGNLTIGGSVTTINKYLFGSCGLTSVTIPTSVTVIDDHAFRNNSISSLTLGHVVDLGDECFGYNSGLTLTINANVTTTRVGTYSSAPFESCSIGANLTIGGSVTTINKNLLAYAGLTSVTIPTGVTVIEDYAFRNNSISSLTLGHVVDLGDECFASNSGLTLTINANVTTTRVGSYVSSPFEACSIGANLTIGGSVTTIDKNLLAYAGLTSVTIPSSVTVIEDYAFRNNSISSLTLDYVVDLGDECFAYNSGLTLTINANVTTTRVGSYTFSPFESCSIGANLTIGGSVTTIANYIFASSGITSITLSENITSVGNSALRNNTNLSSITVNNPSTTFGSNQLDGNMTGAPPKGIIYGFAGSTAYTLYLSYTSYYDFSVLASLEYEMFIGQYVKVFIDSDLHFTGIADNISKYMQDESSNKVNLDVHCSGLNQIAGRRTIKVDYDEGDATDDIVDDMIDNYLYQEGIEAGTINAGINIGEDWIDDCISISDVLDRCAEKNGFQWYIDNDMKLHFLQDPASISNASHQLVDDNGFTDYRNVRINQTLDGYINKLFVIGGNDDDGNQIFSVRGDLSIQNEMQEITAGSGVYGQINRDGANVEYTENSAEAGTTTTNIKITGHNLVVGDYLYNKTRLASTYVTVVVDVDNVTVETVASQTTGDNILIFTSSNKISRNTLKKTGQFQHKISFETFEIDFAVATKLNVALAKLGISSSYWNIEEINMVNVGLKYFKSTVTAVLRNNSDFSTQKCIDGLSFFKGF